MNETITVTKSDPEVGTNSATEEVNDNNGAEAGKDICDAENWHEENGSLKSNKLGNKVGIVLYNRESRYVSDKKLFNEDNQLIVYLYIFAYSDTEERNNLKLDFCPKDKVKLGPGTFDLLVPIMFLQELKKVLEYGLLKLYLQKKDSILFLKGKIDIRGQIRNYISVKPKIACIYWDLTTNHQLNQLILCALNHLIGGLYTETSIKHKLIDYGSLLRQEWIEEISFIPSDLERIRYVPPRYVKLINLSKAIIKRKYHNSKIGEVECSAFLINAAKVWESAIRAAIRKKAKEEKEGNWRVESVNEKLILLSPQLKNIRPDIILSNDKHYIIIDAKYKVRNSSAGSADIYQVLCYLGSKQNKIGIAGILFYLNDSDKNSPYEEKYTYSPLTTKPPNDLPLSYEQQIPLYIKGINVTTNNEKLFIDCFIEQVWKEVNTVISSK